MPNSYLGNKRATKSGPPDGTSPFCGFAGCMQIFIGLSVFMQISLSISKFFCPFLNRYFFMYNEGYDRTIVNPEYATEVFVKLQQ